MHRPLLSALAFAALALAAAPAAAHITLVDPPPRHDMQKSGPCGVGPVDMRGPDVTTYQGGQTITVKWTEFVDHPGHYRISFDADGHDDFVDPAAYDDYYTNTAVLVDQIADQAGQNIMYEQEITLPEMSCDNCTLQLVQMMTDKPPYGDGNDLYYQCADIVIEGAASGTSGDTTGDATTGDATTGGPTGTTMEPGSTSHASHGGTTSDPTTGGGSSGGGSSGDGSSGGATGSTGAATGDPMTGDPEGCGCRSDGSPAAWGLVALVLALRPRRRGA